MSPEDPFKYFGKDPLSGDSAKNFDDSIKSFGESLKNFSLDEQVDENVGKPIERQSITASPDGHRANLEHLKDVQEFKMLQLVIVFSKAEGKTLSETLNEEELKKLRELSARISTEERISILAEVNATVAKNKAAQNRSESVETLVVCKSCGKKVKAGKFCGQCGKPMELIEKGKSILEADENKFFCSKCGKIVKSGKICENCGGLIFNGAERTLFRIMDIDVSYPADHPGETLKLLKTQRNAYIKENYQGETGRYKNEAEVGRVLEIYKKLMEKLS
ncbi:MAG: zinc ribbon domain-containing protein [Candidatus Moraniibacteriota bacterium]